VAAATATMRGIKSMSSPVRLSTFIESAFAPIDEGFRGEIDRDDYSIQNWLFSVCVSISHLQPDQR